MKTIVKIVILLCIVNAHSQKVKIKKGTVSIDKEEVCKLIEKEKNHYKLQSLEGKEVLDFEFESNTIETLEGDKRFDFLKFKNNEQVYYSDYDLSGLKMSFSGKKTLVRYLIKKSQFLNKDGINYTKIKDFFSEPRPRSSKMDEKIAQYKDAYQAVEDFNLKIEGYKIIKKEEKDIFVGSYKIVLPKESSGFTKIKVFDAKGFLTGTHIGSSIRLFDGNKIKFIAISNNNVKNAKKVIKRMIIAGYTLGDMQAKKANIRIKNHKNKVKSKM